VAWPKRQADTPVVTPGRPRGGQTAAVLSSLTSTCQPLGVEPWAYLQDVLTRLPASPAAQLGDLLPDYWQAAYRTKTATPAAARTDAHPGETTS
jgi:hypothetical protein